MDTNLIIKLAIEALQSLRTDKPDLYNEIMRHLLHLPLSNDDNDPRSGLLANIESLYTEDPILLSDIIMEGTGMVLVDPSLLRTIEEKIEMHMSSMENEFCSLTNQIHDIRAEGSTLESNMKDIMEEIYLMENQFGCLTNQIHDIREEGSTLESNINDMMKEIYFPNRK